MDGSVLSVCYLNYIDDFPVKSSLQVQQNCPFMHLPRQDDNDVKV